MRTILLLGVGALFVATSSVATAPGQVRPGEMTRAEVWVQNQPLAVDVTHASLESPLRVFVVNGGQTGATPLQVNLAPRTWEYRSIAVPSGADAATVLGAPGTQGWEAIGVVLSSATGTQVLMKRPH